MVEVFTAEKLENTINQGFPRVASPHPTSHFPSREPVLKHLQAQHKMGMSGRKLEKQPGT